jgi:hypothetical protein
MRYMLTLLLMLFMATPAYARGRSIPPPLISQIQAEYGQVVGVRQDPSGQTAQVQALMPDGRVVIVTIDLGSNSIIDVRK